jgi:uncharacterized protein
MSYEKLGDMRENTQSHEGENTTSDKNQKRTSRKRQFENAFIGGISGGLLSSCLSNEIPCTAILIPTAIGIPDPEGAASLIEMLDRITKNEKLNLDAKQLRKEGAGLRKQMEEIIKSLRDQQQIQQEGVTEQRPIMYGYEFYLRLQEDLLDIFGLNKLISSFSSYRWLF